MTIAPELKVLLDHFVTISPNTGKYTVEDYDGFCQAMNDMYHRQDAVRQFASLARKGMVDLASKAVAGKFQG